MVAASVIQKVDGKRLQRAVEGLVSGAYTVTVTRRDEEMVSGYVANGDGKEYGVVLAEGHTLCSCPDAMYRGVTCKHMVILALHVIRTPQERPQEGEQSVCDHNAPYGSVTGCRKCGSLYLHEGEPKPFPKLARVRSSDEIRRDTASWRREAGEVYGVAV